MKCQTQLHGHRLMSYNIIIGRAHDKLSRPYRQFGRSNHGLTTFSATKIFLLFVATRGEIFSLKFTKYRSAAGLRPDPLGEIKHSPRPPSLLLKGGKGRERMGGRRRRGREGRGGEASAGRSTFQKPTTALVVDVQYNTSVTLLVALCTND